MRRLAFPRPSLVWITGVILLAVVAVGMGIGLYPKIRNRAIPILQRLGLIEPGLPLYLAPTAPPDRVTARRWIVANLYEALSRRDFAEAAAINSTLSQEAFQRADDVLQAWEGVRDPETGLLPWTTSTWHQQWSPRRAAGNLYGYLLTASLYLRPESAPRWLQLMEYEHSVCGAMPCSIDLRTGQVISDDLDWQMLGVNEYGREGLLSVTERFGSGPWLERLREMTDAMLQMAYVQTPLGLLPAASTEVNGSQLQLLSRLYWLSRDERYLQMAERIAEVYLFDVFVKNNGLPSSYWDFSAAKPLPEDPRFRSGSDPQVIVFNLMDHGGEIISGLVEIYYLEKMLGRPQADRYRQPIQDFLDRVMTTGRTPEGLWVRNVRLDTLEPFINQPLDTWGYNLSAYQTFQMLEGTRQYDAEIERMMRAVASQHSIDWEFGIQQDGYADTIESMLYLLPWHDIPEAHYWVDDEIEVMFLKQQPDGFVENWVLDGNFVRTALLYAQYKTQGLMLSPWAENVRLGAAFDPAESRLYVYAAAQADWQGTIRFDTPRHQTFWGMPFEYPRLGELPEWVVVDAQGLYLVTNLDTGETSEYTGQQLAQGLPVTLDSLRGRVLEFTVVRK